MKSLLLLAIATLIGLTVDAQSKQYFAVDGLAIKGYDAVAYFTENKPVKGDSSFTTEWGGTKWAFSSKENLDAFTATPEKYAPQYGGYCAYGCSESHQSPTDPNAFTIVDSKLYLNYNSKVKGMWSKEMITRIEAADAYWKSLAN